MSHKQRYLQSARASICQQNNEAPKQRRCQAMIAQRTRCCQSAAVRNAVLLSLSIVLFLCAGFIWYRWGGGEDRAPTDESSWMYFVCEECGNYFYLNGAEMERALSQRQVGRGPDGKTMLVPCKGCGRPRGVRAERCPQHGEIIKLAPGENDRWECSQCGFRPRR